MVRRLLFAALAVLGVAGPAWSQKGPAGGTPVEAVQGLPAELAGFQRFGEVTDYGQRAGDPRLGASVEYSASPGGGRAIATIYVYSGGRSGLQDGADTPEVRAQLETMGREVDAVARQRGNTLLGEATAAPIPGRAGRPALRCNQYLLRTRNGGPLDSYGCIGVVGGRFLKIRMTSTGPVPANQEALAAFGRGIVVALGG